MTIYPPQTGQPVDIAPQTGSNLNLNWVVDAASAIPLAATADQFRWGEFTRSSRRPPPQAGVMTAKKLKDLILAGYGQGHEQHYKPWLRVTRGDYSPCSRVGHLDYPEMFRLMHPRSMGERYTFCLARWLRARDVRDAHPVWLSPHRHPGHGLPGFGFDHEVPGMLDIAAECGIKVGYYPGTNLPYVSTLDSLTTWDIGDGRLLVALENKPESLTYEPNPLLRRKEKLELTRRYCNAAGIRRLIIHAEKFPLELLVNIDSLRPTKPAHVVAVDLSSPMYRSLVDAARSPRAPSTPLAVMAHEASARYGGTRRDAERLLHLALWRQDIDHDLRLPLRPSEPPVPGGQAVQRALRRAITGVSQ